MVAVGKGANEAVQKQIATLGTNLIVVMPGTGMTSRCAQRIRERLHAHRKRRQGDSSRRYAVAQVAYVIHQMAQVQYRDRNWTTLIGGVTPNSLPTTNWEIESGRSITDQDENTGAPVALIGRSVYQGSSLPTKIRLEQKFSFAKRQSR